MRYWTSSDPAKELEVEERLDGLRAQLKRAVLTQDLIERAQRIAEIEAERDSLRAHYPPYQTDETKARGLFQEHLDAAISEATPDRDDPKDGVVAFVTRALIRKALTCINRRTHGRDTRSVARYLRDQQTWDRELPLKVPDVDSLNVEDVVYRIAATTANRRIQDFIGAELWWLTDAVEHLPAIETGAQAPQPEGENMEKLGVEMDDQKTKTAAEGEKACSKCSAKLEQHGTVMTCPNCGSEPTEKTDEP